MKILKCFLFCSNEDDLFSIKYSNRSFAAGTVHKLESRAGPSLAAGAMSFVTGTFESPSLSALLSPRFQGKPESPSQNGRTPSTEVPSTLTKDRRKSSPLLLRREGPREGPATPPRAWPCTGRGRASPLPPCRALLLTQASVSQPHWVSGPGLGGGNSESHTRFVPSEGRHCQLLHCGAFPMCHYAQK